MKTKALIALLLLAATLGYWVLWPQTREQIGTSYGQLYEDNVSGTAIAMASADTYYPWVTSTVGASRNMTLSAATDNITILETGLYLIVVNISFTGNNSTDFLWAVHKNDSAISGLSFQRDMGAAATVGAGGMAGILSLAATDTLNLEVLSTGASKTATVHYVQLNAVLLR